MLSNLEKAILFHKHEANRFRFFNNETLRREHEWVADALQRMKDYSEKTRNVYKNSLRERYKG